MKLGYMKNTWMTLLAILVTAAVGAPAFALTTFNLTAAASTMTLPDGKVVPVWGFANGAGPVTVTLEGGSELVGLLGSRAGFRRPRGVHRARPPPGRGRT